MGKKPISIMFGMVLNQGFGSLIQRIVIVMARITQTAETGTILKDLLLE